MSLDARRIRHLLVDDAQHLDPQAAQLITLVGTGTLSTIIAADTDQSVFGFRGASPRFANGLAEPGSPFDILLEHDHRARPELSRLGRAIAARLPGARPHPYPDPVTDSADADPGALHTHATGLAARFRALIGESPMQYCARWRMLVAANMLPKVSTVQYMTKRLNLGRVVLMRQIRLNADSIP